MDMEALRASSQPRLGLCSAEDKQYTCHYLGSPLPTFSGEECRDAENLFEKWVRKLKEYAELENWSDSTVLNYA